MSSASCQQGHRNANTGYLGSRMACSQQRPSFLPSLLLQFSSPLHLCSAFLIAMLSAHWDSQDFLFTSPYSLGTSENCPEIGLTPPCPHYGLPVSTMPFSSFQRWYPSHDFPTGFLYLSTFSLLKCRKDSFSCMFRSC